MSRFGDRINAGVMKQRITDINLKHLKFSKISNL